MALPIVECEEELIQLINEIGFLPFFESPVPGFSLKDCVPPELWFPEEGTGVWEWKGPVVVGSDCAYGKFFRNKAGFISREWFLDFANYRRDGYDFDACYDDGLASFAEKRVYDALAGEESLLSKELKRRSGYWGEGRKGFDGVLVKLQKRCYITTTNFEYEMDRHGKPYGWGVARYATPEQHFGSQWKEMVYCRTPEQSAERIMEHLTKLLPRAPQSQLEKILG